VYDESFASMGLTTVGQGDRGPLRAVPRRPDARQDSLA